MEIKPDVIVIGAGPAGVAAALSAKRKGLNVVVIERGKNFGTKNMFGGAVYLESLKALFPDSWENIPFERFNISHSFEFLTQNGASTAFSYFDESHKSSATVFRPKFDEWLVEEAKKEGVYFVLFIMVRNLIVEDNKVVGIKTDIEELKAPLTIIAEGANSLLTEQIGLKKKNDSKDLILGVKEIIKLDKNLINQRFNLKDDEGKVLEFFGGLDPDILTLGFFYTFKNHIAIGLGACLKDLGDKKTKPYELLDKLKSHPQIQKLIEGGEVVEYSAHLIPDGGYKKLSKLYSSGVLVVGDAAGFINPVHFEGTNLAIHSGLIAGEVAYEAFNKKDFSSKTLSNYKKKIDKSFIITDLKSYKNALNAVYKRKKSVGEFYPNIMSDFFKKFTSANGVPKKKLLKEFIKDFFFSRNIKEIIADCCEFAKVFIEVIK